MNTGQDQDSPSFQGVIHHHAHFSVGNPPSVNMNDQAFSSSPQVGHPQRHLPSFDPTLNNFPHTGSHQTQLQISVGGPYQPRSDGTQYNYREDDIIQDMQQGYQQGMQQGDQQGMMSWGHDPFMDPLPSLDDLQAMINPGPQSHIESVNVQHGRYSQTMRANHDDTTQASSTGSGPTGTSRFSEASTTQEDVETRDDDQVEGGKKTKPRKRKADEVTDDGAKSATSAKRRLGPHKKPKVALHVSAKNIEPLKYENDNKLNSLEYSLTYLLKPDDTNVQFSALSATDDWENVEEYELQNYIGQIYEALLHAPAENGPPGITLNEALKKELANQQNNALINLNARLHTGKEQKDAQARARILIHVVISAHQSGVSKDIHDGYHSAVSNRRPVKREHQLDATSICSARLDKIVSIIKENKLVAIDVIEHRNFEKIMLDPDFYLLEKVRSFVSNQTRKNARETQKVKAAQGPVIDGATGRASVAKGGKGPKGGKERKARKARSSYKRTKLAEDDEYEESEQETYEESEEESGDDNGGASDEEYLPS